MNAPRTSAYRRLAGVVRMNGRSAILETGAGELLFLVSKDDLAPYDGRSIVVEGQMSGHDRMVLAWFGAVTD